MSIATWRPTVPAGAHIVCSGCSLITGSFLDEAGVIRAVTRCACDRLPAFVEQPLPEQSPILTWESRQFAARAHVACAVCLAAWVPFWSRYAHRVCGSCLGPVRQLNALVGRVVVPVGHHSLNNLLQRPPAGPVAAEIAEAAAIVTGAAHRPREANAVLEHLATMRFTRRADRLHEQFEIDRNLAKIRAVYGPDGIAGAKGDDVPLAVYLTTAAAFSEGSHSALRRLAVILATIDGVQP